MGQLETGRQPTLEVAGSDEQLIQVMTPAGAVTASSTNITRMSAVVRLAATMNRMLARLENGHTAERRKLNRIQVAVRSRCGHPDGMNLKHIGIAAAMGASAVAIGTGIATAEPDDGEGTPITADALIKATAAALAFSGGGTVTGTEVGDGESLYEVEVTLADGNQVDVQLDPNFVVVESKTEPPGADVEPDADDGN